MEAGKLDQGGNSIGIGTYAAKENQAGNSIAIGNEAGATNQNTQSIAIGVEAGKLDQSSNSIGIGTYAASSNQGADSVAIGNLAAVQNQANNSIAIGYFAGNNSQQLYSIGIGTYAGENTQGVSSVAVGNKAGMTTQQDYSVAIGYQCGYDTQGTGSVAIGNNSGNNNQGSSSVAIGEFSGYTNQGSNCIAIGSNAGYTGQPANTNVIGVFNTTDTYPNSSATYIKPIRQFADAMSYGFRSLAYNPTTGEIVQGVSGSAGSEGSGGYGGSFDPFLGMSITSVTPSTIYSNISNSMQMTIFCMTPLMNTIEIGYGYTGSTGPTAIATAATPISIAGIVNFNVTPVNNNPIYFYIKATTMWGLIATNYVKGITPIIVSSTSVSSSSLPSSLVLSTAVTGSTITLLGSIFASATSSNFQVFLNTSGAVGTPGSITNYSYSSNTVVITFSITPTVTGVNTLYVKYTDSLSNVTNIPYLGSNNLGYFVDAATSTFKMPTSILSYTPSTGYKRESATTMIITTTGGAGPAGSLTFYYGSSTGATSISSLTQGGTSTILSNTSSISVQPLVGTWYPYIMITSPFNITGSLIGSNVPFTSRSYIHATSIVSYTPTTIVSGDTPSFTLTFGGYDTELSGTALVYYSTSSTSSSGVFTQLGSAVTIVNGLVSFNVSAIIPASVDDYYLYARTISTLSVQGPILSSTTRLKCRSYVFPTIFTCNNILYATFTRPMYLTFSVADTIASATVVIYYHSTNSSTNPTQCSTGATGTINKFGMGLASYYLPTAGDFYLYAKVTAFGVVGSFIVTSSPVTVRPPPLRIRYIRLVNATTTDSITCSKIGIYPSESDANADNGNSTNNVVYAARNVATITLGNYMTVVGTALNILSATSWAYSSTDYINLKMPQTTSLQNNVWTPMATFDLTSAYAIYEFESELFIRFSICGGTNSRLRLQVSADNLTYYDRIMAWTTNSITYETKTSQWFTIPASNQMASIPTSFMISNRTTATPRDLSVDSNRTNVTRGTRLWDKITITTQNFSYAYNEEWWYITNGIRGSVAAPTTVPAEQNSLGNQLVVGGGLVFAHNLYSFNCQNLYFTTSWETGTYNALWGVWASNDQVNWTLMKSSRWTDSSNAWNPNSGDGGILAQGANGGTANRFYKFSWVNTQYYVYWKIGIMEIGNQVVSGYSQPAAGLGCLYEIEWG